MAEGNVEILLKPRSPGAALVSLRAGFVSGSTNAVSAYGGFRLPELLAEEKSFISIDSSEPLLRVESYILKLSHLLIASSLFNAVCGSALAQDYQVISVSNAGTITGTVKWSGPMPHIPTLAISKDAQICDPEGKKTRDLERLIIGPQGGVANTVVFLKDIARGKSMDLPEQRRFLDQKRCRYEPHILLVPKKATLQMKSSDAVLHTVHMDGASTYNLPFPFPNQLISRDMSTPGLVNLKCNGGHMWMNAEMLVVSHPYYAVTDESGKFQLSDIPPGEYEVVAWHEGWGVARQEGSFDVLTERRIERPVFTEPRTWVKKISVQPGAPSTLNFVIAEK